MLIIYPSHASILEKFILYPSPLIILTKGVTFVTLVTPTPTNCSNPYSSIAKSFIGKFLIPKPAVVVALAT
ncbi:MAG: hypothetical protein NZ879_08460, partial [Archaeoglobaceae archaeon]|nr:hypothetical protein [Archaeoglobaceae archaeon]MDW8118997.1 hypothetical protein [Archaeoglobaceae archaeon]